MECEILLNHPAVSRAQAGIKEVDGDYYLFSLRPGNPPKLNGKALEDNQALAPGDVIVIGPFVLEIDRTDEGLVIKVALQIGKAVDPATVSSPQLDTTKELLLPDPARKRPGPRDRSASGTKTLDIFWDKRFARRAR